MSTDNNTKTDSPFNMWWVVSGIGAVLVVVALILVLVFGRGGGSDDAAPAETSSASSAPAASSSADDSVSSTGCDLDDSNQDIPVKAPEATWTAVDYLLVPSSNEFGPAPLEGSEWACFAHSPTGALFAAAHVLVGAGGPEFETFMNDAAVENTARSTWIAGENPATHTQAPGSVAQFAGFQMASVETDRVTVKLAMQQSDITGSYTADMIWDDTVGTWKVDMGSSTFFDTPALLENLDTFVPWSATDGS
jgi:hypothetical protein